MSTLGHEPDAVPSATSLPASPQGDHRKRVRNYLISMTIRTLCFVLAVVFTGPLRWTFVALAVLLPYVAVVAANTSQQRRIDVLGSVQPERQHRQIGPGDPRGPGHAHP